MFNLFNIIRHFVRRGTFKVKKPNENLRTTPADTNKKAQARTAADNSDSNKKLRDLSMNIK